MDWQPRNLLIITLVGMFTIGIVAHHDYLEKADPGRWLDRNDPAFQTTLQRNAPYLTDEQEERWRTSFQTTLQPILATGPATN